MPALTLALPLLAPAASLAPLAAFASSPSWLPGITSALVLREGPPAWTLRVEGTTPIPWRATLQVTVEAARIAWSLVEGDARAISGAWTLEPATPEQPHGALRLRVEIDAGYYLPGSAWRTLSDRWLPAALHAGVRRLAPPAEDTSPLQAL